MNALGKQIYIRSIVSSHSCSLVLVLNGSNAYYYHLIFHNMTVYIHKGTEGGEKIGCANNIISGVINEQADDEKH